MSRGLNNICSDYVYRVLRPNEDPNNDLTCVNSYSSYTVDEHVQSGLHTPTRFISTTTDIDKALKWMETADNSTSQKYRNKRSVIVIIDIELIKRKYPNVANSAYDFTNSSNRNYFLKNVTQKSFAGAYSEIVFERYIPSEAVSVFYTTKDGYVDRQKFPFHSQIGETCYQSNLPTISNQITPMQNGIAPSLANSQYANPTAQTNRAVPSIYPGNFNPLGYGGSYQSNQITPMQNGIAPSLANSQYANPTAQTNQAVPSIYPGSFNPLGYGGSYQSNQITPMQNGIAPSLANSQYANPTAQTNRAVPSIYPGNFNPLGYGGSY